MWFLLLGLLISFHGIGQQHAEYVKDIAHFPIGVAVGNKYLFQLPKYEQTVKDEFNSITAEGVMKMQTIQPSRNEFNFAPADSMIAFAEENKMRVHGHCLVWHEALPNWIRNFKGDSAELEQILRRHICYTVSNYKGRVASWDVVNEAFLDSAGAIRPSVWSNKLGSDYIARAFQYARSVDGSVKLFYNDYGLEYSEPKLNAVLKMVKEFKKRGIPIDGIGLQMHTDLLANWAAIEKTIIKISRTGLLVHISELDISVNGKVDKDGGVQEFTPELAKEQAFRMKLIAKSYEQLPRTQKWGITFWGVDDSHSWVRKFYHKQDWPLLFDENYQRKPIYYGFMNGLR